MNNWLGLYAAWEGGTWHHVTRWSLPAVNRTPWPPKQGQWLVNVACGYTLVNARIEEGHPMTLDDECLACLDAVIPDESNPGTPILALTFRVGGVVSPFVSPVKQDGLDG